MCKTILFLSNRQTSPESVETVVINEAIRTGKLSWNCIKAASYELQATSISLFIKISCLTGSSLQLVACGLQLLSYLCAKWTIRYYRTGS